MRYIYPLTNTVRACLTVRQARTGFLDYGKSHSAFVYLGFCPWYLFSGFAFTFSVLIFLLMQGVQRLRQLHRLPGV